MRRSFIFLGAIAVLGVMPEQAGAQSSATNVGRGYYVEGAGGGNWLSDTDGSYQLRPDHPFLPNLELPSSSEWNTGWGISARLGYAWTSGLRMDGEVSYRRNELDKSNFVGTDGINFFDVTDDGASGHTRSIAIMANAYYDFLNSTGITPYVGVGIGAANVGGDFKSSFHVETQNVDRLSDNDWGFAAQAIGGVSIALSRNLSLVADYRYFRAFDISTSEEQPLAPANPTFAAARIGSDGDQENHTVMIGLRYTFDSDGLSLK